MLKPITISIGIAAATAFAQPTLAANSPTQATVSQPATNLISQVVVSFPSAKIKLGSTTVILGGKSNSSDRYKEERYERRHRRSNWEYYRYRNSDRHDDYNYHQDRDDDRH
jgi:hypothetical protein